jgi:aminoglycoside phosphotransferase
VAEVEVVVAHHECATVRVGDVFLKIDADQTRTDVEVAAMALAPIPTPRVLWRQPPVLALAALRGTALGRLGEPSITSSAAWAAAGAAARVLHDAPLPPWPGRSPEEIASRLDDECEWLVTNGVLPTDLVTCNRRVAEAALRPWTPVFTHGDLQVAHVFVDGDEVTGVVDWSEAGHGDALYDLATLTLGHEEHLGDVVAGYGTDVDLDVIRAWWSLRSLLAVRWLVEHGFDPYTPGCEVDVLRTVQSVDVAAGQAGQAQHGQDSGGGERQYPGPPGQPAAERVVGEQPVPGIDGADRVQCRDLLGEALQDVSGDGECRGGAQGS